MPRVKCPNCDTVRVIMDGKVKQCLQCHTRLTTLPVLAKPEPDTDAIVGMLESEHLEITEGLPAQILVLESERTLAVAQIQAHEATIGTLQDKVLHCEDLLSKELDALTTAQACESLQLVAADIVARSAAQLTPKGQKWAAKMIKAVVGDIAEMVIPPAPDEKPGSEGESTPGKTEGDPPA